jgi:hypothetical protein
MGAKIRREKRRVSAGWAVDAVQKFEERNHGFHFVREK